jgi:hypothetical protein
MVRKKKEEKRQPQERFNNFIEPLYSNFKNLGILFSLHVLLLRSQMTLMIANLRNKTT